MNVPKEIALLLYLIVGTAGVMLLVLGPLAWQIAGGILLFGAIWFLWELAK